MRYLNAKNTFTGDAVFKGTGVVKLPVGTVAQRPSSPSTGDTRYNTELGSLEFYDGVAWVSTNSRSYGVSWDQNSDSYARTANLKGHTTGQSPTSLMPVHELMRRCLLQDNGTVNYYLDPNDSTKKENGDASVLTGADGQVMVEIPKFYLKYAYSSNVHTWDISLVNLDGFSLHPAFNKNGSEVSHRYIGAYEGVWWDASNGYQDSENYIGSYSTGYTGTYVGGYSGGYSGNYIGNYTGAYIGGFQGGYTGIYSNQYQGGYTLTYGSMGESPNPRASSEGPTYSGIYSQGWTGVYSGIYSGPSSGEYTEDYVGIYSGIYSGPYSGIYSRGYVGTYTGDTLDTSNDKLSSVSGFCPLTDKTRAEFRSIAGNRGAGWRQLDYDLLSAIQLLYLIEYADFDSQSMIGMGRTELSGGDWGVGSYIGETGLSNGDGNGTNAVAYDGDAYDAGAENAYMTYRGIENWYGNVWTWIDGININSNVPYVTNDDSNWADDTSTDYTDLSITLHNANGYQGDLEQTSRGFLPADVTGTSSTKITDYYYQNSGWRVVQFGGSAAATGSDAGGFYLRADAASSVDSMDIGGRLAF